MWTVVDDDLLAHTVQHGTQDPRDYRRSHAHRSPMSGLGRCGFEKPGGWYPIGRSQHFEGTDKAVSISVLVKALLAKALEGRTREKRSLALSLGHASGSNFPLRPR